MSNIVNQRAGGNTTPFSGEFYVPVVQRLAPVPLQILKASMKPVGWREEAAEQPSMEWQRLGFLFERLTWWQ
jgi:hypothetical protein